jgi:stress response protein SCP2
VTTTLAKGQNAPLPVTDVVVSVQVGAAADLSALLVKADGKVRSEADFVFYNQPSGPGVDLTPGSGGQPGTLAVSLGRVPADITTVRAVVTLDDASSTFRRAGVPVARVADTSGTTLFEFVVEGLDTESIVIALELYRRGDDWKVRAVGQGYAGGFAALVTDHGIEVEEPAAPA